jgi:hypothetical protein
MLGLPRCGQRMDRLWGNILPRNEFNLLRSTHAETSNKSEWIPQTLAFFISVIKLMSEFIQAMRPLYRVFTKHWHINYNILNCHKLRQKWSYYFYFTYISRISANLLSRGSYILKRDTYRVNLKKIRDTKNCERVRAW